MNFALIFSTPIFARLIVIIIELVKRYMRKPIIWLILRRGGYIQQIKYCKDGSITEWQDVVKNANLGEDFEVEIIKCANHVVTLELYARANTFARIGYGILKPLTRGEFWDNPLMLNDFDLFVSRYCKHALFF